MTKTEQLLAHLKEHGPCKHSELEPLFPTIWNNILRAKLIQSGRMRFREVENPNKGRGHKRTVRVYEYVE